MNRSFFAKLPDFEGKDAFIDAIMAENGRDIEKAKGNADALKGELEAAKLTISDLEKNKGDVSALQKQLDDYHRADDERKKAEEASSALPISVKRAIIYT